MSKTLYLVEHWISDSNSDTGVIGLFDTEKAAIEACRSEDHFYMKLLLNEDLGDEIRPFTKDEQCYPVKPALIN